MDEKPVAWIHKWAFDGEELCKEKREKLKNGLAVKVQADARDTTQVP